MSITIDDAVTIRAFRHGDDTAFDKIVAEYRQELLRHARRRVPDNATAEDLVQETFFRAYRAFGRLPDDSRIRPWLHQILRNVCIDDSHRRSREHQKTERAFNESRLGSLGEGPEEVLGLGHDASDALAAALTGLPATHRDAFVQRVVVGLEYDEIAAREGVSEPNARARVSRARTALRRALQGAAAVPVACYLVIRRPGRSALAASADPPVATAVASSPTTVDTASRLATTLAPAMEAATSVATGATHSVPLLTKAAVGIGAVATVTFATAPERPIEIPPAVTVEVTADALDDTPTVPAPAPARTQPVVVSPTTAPPTTATATTVPATTTSVAGQLAPEEPVVVLPAAPPGDATTVPATTTSVGGHPPPEEPVVVLPAAPPGDATAEPGAPSGPTQVATTTVAPTSLPASTMPPTTMPPLVGGSLQASVSVTPAGPRLDVSGPVTLAIGDAQQAGSISGRLGAGEPDPAASRRLDGTFTISVDGGTIELRLAGYGTSTEAPQAGVAPTTLTMSGVYRASGATGQLATSGSFSGSLTSTTLTLTLSI